LRVNRGKSKSGSFKISFDRRIKLHFHGAKLSSDGGLVLFRAFAAALGLAEIATSDLRDRRTGLNTQHTLLACSGSPCLDAWPAMRT